MYDYNPGFGGPIAKDKLWFFATARWTEAVNQVPNDYPNKNFTVGSTPSTLLNATTLAYVPNTSAPLDQTYGGGGHFWEQTMRLTWQASPKNKFAAYYNNKKRVYTNGVSNTSHEALATTYFFPFSDNLLQWSSPLTNKFLLEAAFWRHQETWGSRQADPSFVDPLAVGVTKPRGGEGATRDCAEPPGTGDGPTKGIAAGYGPSATAAFGGTSCAVGGARTAFGGTTAFGGMTGLGGAAGAAGGMTGLGGAATAGAIRGAGDVVARAGTAPMI